MPTQSRTRQRQIIASATKDNALDTLYWFVEMDLPLRYGGKSAAASCFGGVPVIQLGTCPDASEAEAELLRWHFEDNNLGRGISFHLALTTLDVLQKTGATWYLWGYERTGVDNICPECGQIHVTEYHETWGCCGWSQIVRLNQEEQ